MIFRLLVYGVFITFLDSCAHSVHQLYVSSMDRNMTYDKGEWVTVEQKDFVVLSFQTKTDYVQSGYHELEKKCKGRISQVTTEHVTSFFFLSYDQRIILRGLCRKS
ncbi:MAG: hypothetical protein HQK54_05360 [Oligoflexales bacterium]|nr:hypothetical protein [Oligoflexales bacterium]